MTLRSALAWSAVCGTLCAAFVALRGSLSVPAFFVIAGAAALCLAPLLTSLTSLRAPSRALLGFLVGLGLAALPLAVLARVLKLTTHHRPLGAVTFAFLALFVVAGTIAIALRAVSRPEASKLSRWVERAVLACSLLSVLGLLLPLVRDAATQRGVLDVGLGLGSAAVAALLPWPQRARGSAERVGPWLWVVLVAVGLVCSFGSARGVAAAASPALAAPFAWF